MMEVSALPETNEATPSDEPLALAQLTNPSELGDYLRQAREAQGKTIAQINEITSIRERYLLALEKGEVQDLPGDVYAKAYYINYAETLGIDVSAAAARLFGAKSKVSPILTSNAPMVKPARRAAGRLYVVGGVVLAVLVVLVFQQNKLAFMQDGASETTPKLVSPAPASRSDDVTVKTKEDNTHIKPLAWMQQDHAIELAIRSPKPQQVILKDDTGLTLLQSTMRSEQVVFVPIDRLRPKGSLTLYGDQTISLYINGVAFRLPEQPTLAGVTFRVWDLLALTNLLPLETEKVADSNTI